jgi:hypothetical protein
MGEEEVSALKERTEKKIDYAKLMLDELSHRPSSAGRGDSFERAHEEAVLFHVIGAKDAFLQEINAAYKLGLKRSNVTENNLCKAFVTKGKTCPTLQELMLLKEDESSWLYEANLLRNHGTHRGGLTRTFFAGGEYDDEVFYKDPRDPNKHIAEEDTYKYLDRCIQEMKELIQRLRDTFRD